MLMAIWVRHFPLRVGRGDRGKRHVYLTKVTPPATQHPDRLISFISGAENQAHLTRERRW